VFSLVCSICLVLPDADAQSKRPWTGTISGHPVPSKHGLPQFVLLAVNQDELHLTGACVYDNSAVGTRTARAITIEGTESDGIFWPDVTSQVTNNPAGKWKTIARPVQSAHAQAIIVKPNEARFNLMVALDAFQPLIGKYKFGRVALKTGDAASFELKDLLPPERTGQ
jgi:hypothetical protein